MNDIFEEYTVLIMKRFSVILILIITCAAVLYGCTSGGENKMAKFIRADYSLRGKRNNGRKRRLYYS